ncbi:MAG: DUF58 domain-containing protein [Pseudomonadota bacterium]
MKAAASPPRGLAFLPLRTPLLRRLFRLRALEPLPFTVTARRIYILPTRQGLAFALLLMGMLLGAMNYGLSMGFLFTFLLAGMLLSALFATWRGLLGIRLAGIEAEPGFAGGEVRFTLDLRLPDPATAAALVVAAGDTQATPVPGQNGAARALLSLPARQRGRQALGPCRLYSEAPLGLFRAWAVFTPAAAALVWPKPSARGLPLPAPGGMEDERPSGSQRGSEDFDGLTGYQPGESPSRLVWKSLARHAEPLVKSFVSPRGGSLWLDWARLPGMDPETRLAHLARWVLEADRMGLAYGLHLPGLRIPPAGGPLQRLRCLNALALHGQAAQGDADAA